MIQQHVGAYMEFGIQYIYIYISFDPAPIHELRLKDFADGDDISEIAGRCTSEVARLNYVDTTRIYLKIIFSAGMGHPKFNNLDTFKLICAFDIPLQVRLV